MAVRLLAGEHALLMTRPHWRRLVAPAVTLIVVCALTGFALGSVPSGTAQGPIRWAILGLAGLLAVWRCLVPYARWLAARYVVTSHRIVVRDGLLVRRGTDIPLSRITDVGFRQGPVERLLGTGTLIVESGGARGRLELPDVPEIDTFCSIVHERLVGSAMEFGRGGEPASATEL
ncbi:membrane-flanked domain protein [Acidothermus cellulolyticus 11B]|uniref:Membrane-flanked domain protein n=1 Tax=Acidothermus cellulolyticus (strain ATCC 43068 / DSM 8971 / 11B) TaxID=351607 RepID=A0LRW3_ACIC1|nr:PH domain-containing protein [Acidothermus cellulolyticus]ABK52173.1 membrane-flanked domain protein [Acidothermus cellulolyticus 11B]